MGTKFGGNFPALRKEARQQQYMVLGIAGLAFSLIVILLVVLNSRSVDATQDRVYANSSELAPAMVGTVTLYAAERPIRAGSKLSDYADSFKPVYWPRNSVPAEAIMDMAEIRNQFARVDIPANVPVDRSHLTKEEATVASLPLTPGMRAVTIEVDAQQGIEGWAEPGTRVDVVLTYMVDAQLTSKVIVQNARVLSTGGSVESSAKTMGLNRQSRLKANNTITLETSPQDALKITTSKKLGDLNLLMRDSTDNQANAVVELSQSELGKGSSKTAKENPHSCQRGKMRIDGKEYVIDCDGSFSQVVESDEP